MEMELAELAQIVEAEIEVGEELRHNLEAQRRAVVDWDAGALFEQIQAREPWLRSLGELEERRRRILNDSYQEGATLGQIIESWPIDAPDKNRLRELRRRCRRLFTALQAEERDLHRLMDHLLAHIEAAFSAIAAPPAPTYGDGGAAERPRAPAALLHSKA